MSRLVCRCGAVLDETTTMVLKVPAAHGDPQGRRCLFPLFRCEVTVDHSGTWLVALGSIYRTA